MWPLQQPTQPHVVITLYLCNLEDCCHAAADGMLVCCMIVTYVLKVGLYPVADQLHAAEEEANAQREVWNAEKQLLQADLHDQKKQVENTQQLKAQVEELSQQLGSSLTELRVAQVHAKHPSAHCLIQMQRCSSCADLYEANVGLLRTGTVLSVRNAQLCCLVQDSVQQVMLLCRRKPVPLKWSVTLPASVCSL